MPHAGRPHRLIARAAPASAPPSIARDPALLASFLSDAAHVPGGWAAGVAFPTTEAEVAAAVTSADRVLVVGAQSSLTGGATPRGDLILSTRALTRLEEPAGGCIRVQAGVPLAMLQEWLDARGLFYPPAPTYDGASVGGTIATNAAGPATFKYGTTRRWVEALTVVLADGSVLDLVRGQVTASADGHVELEDRAGNVRRVTMPRYVMPNVPKLSAGYFAAPGMDVIDLFIGAEGTLGVIVDATLRVVPRPRTVVAAIVCADEDQAIRVTQACRAQAVDAWHGQRALDTAAVEFVDAAALDLLDATTFARAGVARPDPGACLLIVQVEMASDDEAAFEALVAILDTAGVETDPVMAMPGDASAARRLFSLREAVPAEVNARIGRAQREIDSAIQKTAGDMIVPFEQVAESIACYRRACLQRGLTCLIWGHLSDGNLHPNILPASVADVEAGREALADMARDVIRLGGAPLAEHGVGRNPLKQSFLRTMYGEHGIAMMRDVRRILDPSCRLATGVLFP